MADQVETYTDFYVNMALQDEFKQSIGGVEVRLTEDLIEQKIALRKDAGHLAVMASYQEHTGGVKNMEENWISSSAVVVLSNFRASNSSDRSQIARATITLPRKNSTGKSDATRHTSTHCPLAEKIETCEGVLYVEQTFASPMLFFARNDTQRNSVSL